MIRDGKTAGWLHLPVASFPQWTELNEVVFHKDVTVGDVTGQEERGSTVIARAAFEAPGDLSTVLMKVPRDLVLSVERVREHAKCDQDFRAVLEALGDFGRTPRGAILIFLLFQCFLSNPSMESKVGVMSAYTDYVKFLPLASLPTSWSDSDLEAARTTSLYPATRAKLASLRREYELVRASTRHISFCALHWWDESQGLLTFDDWLQVDAMYRSRALDFPGIGHCMVPSLDMANHASGTATSAIYETNPLGDALLLLRPSQHLITGQEITITYGDDKGACEMLFSYGFLEADVESAREMFMDLALFDHDPLSKPKLALSDSAPGVKLMQGTDGSISFEGDFIWLVCVNGDDGLNFRIRETIDGSTELVAFWGDIEMTSLAELKHLLESSSLYDVYRLRAASVLQDRVARQLQAFVETEDEAAELLLVASTRRELGLALRLRALEYDLAGAAYAYFDDLKSELAERDSVKTYLASMAGETTESEHSAGDTIGG